MLAGPKLIKHIIHFDGIYGRDSCILLYGMDNSSTIYSLTFKTQRRDIQKSESDTDHTKLHTFFPIMKKIYVLHCLAIKKI